MWEVIRAAYKVVKPALPYLARLLQAVERNDKGTARRQLEILLEVQAFEAMQRRRR